MSALALGAVVFACVFGGALVGMFLRRMLPEHHFSSDSRDVVRLGMGLIATMAALLLSLLVASAKSSYDAERSELTQMSAKVLFLDRALANYGPEAQGDREMLRQAAEHAIARIWPPDGSQAQLDPSASGAEALYKRIQQLQPRDDSQRSLKAMALGAATDLSQMRWLLLEQAGSSISTPFLVVVVFWLTLIFVSFGLFAPSNATVIATLLLSALSVAGAIFLLLELDQPFHGLIQISSAPMRQALAHLAQ
jgi:hypothetical protein